MKGLCEGEAGLVFSRLYLWHLASKYSWPVNTTGSGALTPCTVENPCVTWTVQNPSYYRLLSTGGLLMTQSVDMYFLCPVHPTLYSSSEKARETKTLLRQLNTVLYLLKKICF